MDVSFNDTLTMKGRSHDTKGKKKGYEDKQSKNKDRFKSLAKPKVKCQNCGKRCHIKKVYKSNKKDNHYDRSFNINGYISDATIFFNIIDDNSWFIDSSA